MDGAPAPARQLHPANLKCRTGVLRKALVCGKRYPDWTAVCWWKSWNRRFFAHCRTITQALVLWGAHLRSPDDGGYVHSSSSSDSLVRGTATLMGLAWWSGCP